MVLDILVVDSRYASSICIGLAGRLSKEETKVYWVSSGEEAIERIKNSNLDFVVLNHDLGNGIDGYDTALAISKINKNIKIIGFSGGWLEKDIKGFSLATYTRYLDEVARYIKSQ